MPDIHQDLYEQEKIKFYFIFYSNIILENIKKNIV